jgi:hypothetical protein
MMDKLCKYGVFEGISRLSLDATGEETMWIFNMKSSSQGVASSYEMYRIYDLTFK